MKIYVRSHARDIGVRAITVAIEKYEAAKFGIKIGGGGAG